MDSETARKYEGLVTLVRDATVGAAAAIEVAQVDTARTPYAVLGAVPIVGAAAGRIAQVQLGITKLVYRSVRVIAKGSAAVALGAIRAAEKMDAGGA